MAGQTRLKSQPPAGAHDGAFLVRLEKLIVDGEDRTVVELDGGGVAEVRGRPVVAQDNVVAPGMAVVGGDLGALSARFGPESESADDGSRRMPEEMRRHAVDSAVLQRRPCSAAVCGAREARLVWILVADRAEKFTVVELDDVRFEVDAIIVRLDGVGELHMVEQSSRLLHEIASELGRRGARHAAEPNPAVSLIGRTIGDDGEPLAAARFLFCGRDAPLLSEVEP